MSGQFQNFSTRNARKTIIAAPMVESRYLEKREVLTRLRELSDRSDLLKDVDDLSTPHMHTLTSDARRERTV